MIYQLLGRSLRPNGSRQPTRKGGKVKSPLFTTTNLPSLTFHLQTTVHDETVVYLDSETPFPIQFMGDM